MSIGSMLNRIRKPLVGATLAAGLAICSLVAVAPAQASTSPVNQTDVSWQTAKEAPHGGVGIQALCFPPTRYINAAVWDCDVFSGQVIWAWIVCNGARYTSPPIGEGSWRIVGICPAGTIRNDEGIIGA